MAKFFWGNGASCLSGCILRRHGQVAHRFLARVAQIQEHAGTSRELEHHIGASQEEHPKDAISVAEQVGGGLPIAEATAKKRKTGGWRTTPFIFGNELCERLAGFGILVNLVSFLILEMHMPTVEAATIVSNFGGTSGLTPLLGAFIADAYLGRYKTIAISSVIYMVGLGMLTLTAVLPSLRPPSCSYHLVIAGLCKGPTYGQEWYFYTSLFLLAIGGGGIRPSVAAFGADQFNVLDPKEKNELRHFFNWYYFSVGLSILGAVTVIVYIQDNVGWAWGLGIPAIAMAVSLLCFLGGAPFYRYLPPGGSPFTRIAQVIVSAYKKRRIPLPSESSMLHKGDYITFLGHIELHHTNQFTFLDKAAIVENYDKMDTTSQVSPWRLCTVHQIEEFKSLLRLAPIWATTILVSTVIVQQATFSVQQARSMDRHMGSFQIPAASFGVFGILMLLIWVPIYDQLIMKWLKKFTGNEQGISPLQRVGIGLFIAILSMVAAAVVEVKRRNAAHRYGLLDQPDLTIPISAFWLIPQHCLFGLAESFVIIGELEFFYDQSPESMRSTGSALFWSTMAIGNYVSTFIVTVLSRQTKWLENNLNRAHLDYFYWFLAILSGLNLLFFVLSAKWFHYREESGPDVEKSQAGTLPST